MQWKRVDEAVWTLLALREGSAGEQAGKGAGAASGEPRRCRALLPDALVLDCPISTWLASPGGAVASRTGTPLTLLRRFLARLLEACRPAADGTTLAVALYADGSRKQLDCAGLERLAAAAAACSSSAKGIDLPEAARGLLVLQAAQASTGAGRRFVRSLEADLTLAPTAAGAHLVVHCTEIITGESSVGDAGARARLTGTARNLVKSAAMSVFEHVDASLQLLQRGVGAASSSGGRVRLAHACLHFDVAEGENSGSSGEADTTQTSPSVHAAPSAGDAGVLPAVASLWFTGASELALQPAGSVASASGIEPQRPLQLSLLLPQGLQQQLCGVAVAASTGAAAISSCDDADFDSACGACGADAAAKDDGDNEPPPVVAPSAIGASGARGKADRSVVGGVDAALLVSILQDAEEGVRTEAARVANAMEARWAAALEKERRAAACAAEESAAAALAEIAAAREEAAAARVNADAAAAAAAARVREAHASAAAAALSANDAYRAAASDASDAAASALAAARRDAAAAAQAAAAASDTMAAELRAELAACERGRSEDAAAARAAAAEAAALAAAAHAADAHDASALLEVVRAEGLTRCRELEAAHAAAIAAADDKAATAARAAAADAAALAAAAAATAELEQRVSTAEAAALAAAISTAAPSSPRAVP